MNLWIVAAGLVVITMIVLLICMILVIRQQMDCNHTFVMTEARWPHKDKWAVYCRKCKLTLYTATTKHVATYTVKNANETWAGDK